MMNEKELGWLNTLSIPQLRCWFGAVYNLRLNWDKGSPLRMEYEAKAKLIEDAIKNRLTTA